MIFFQEWRKRKLPGLGDYGVRDAGPPDLGNKLLPNKRRAPDLPDAAKWLEPGSDNKSPSFAEARKRDYEVVKIRDKGLPRYNFSSVRSSNTGLDAGGDHRG